MFPMFVPNAWAVRGRWHVGVVPLKPFSHIEQVDLFGPYHSRKRLTLNHLFVGGRFSGLDLSVERIRLLLSFRND